MWWLWFALLSPPTWNLRYRNHRAWSEELLFPHRPSFPHHPLDGQVLTSHKPTPENRPAHPLSVHQATSSPWLCSLCPQSAITRISSQPGDTRPWQTVHSGELNLGSALLCPLGTIWHGPVSLLLSYSGV